MRQYMSPQPDEVPIMAETRNQPVLTSDRRALLAGLGGLAAGTFLTVGRAEAGPLNPPGAPAPTGKPLAELEPRIAINAQNTPGDASALFRITKPGSYYLTGNVQGLPGLNGIMIAASNVSIDLMGFELLGVPGPISGIAVDAPRDQIAICNGSFRGWGGDGIDLLVSNNRGSSSLIENVQSSHNGLFGIRANHQSVVRNCVVANNGSSGISVGESSIIDSCLAFSNGFVAINAGGVCHHQILHCAGKRFRWNQRPIRFIHHKLFGNAEWRNRYQCHVIQHHELHQFPEYRHWNRVHDWGRGQRLLGQFERRRRDFGEQSDQLSRAKQWRLRNRDLLLGDSHELHCSVKRVARD